MQDTPIPDPVSDTVRASQDYATPAPVPFNFLPFHLFSIIGGGYAILIAIMLTAPWLGVIHAGLAHIAYASALLSAGLSYLAAQFSLIPQTQPLLRPLVLIALGLGVIAVGAALGALL